MTFDDDHLVLEFDGGTKRVLLKKIGIDWPPPERINVMGFDMVQTRRSQLTDEQRAEMTHVCRGAEYYPEPSVPASTRTKDA